MNKTLYVFGIIIAGFFAATLVYYYFEAQVARADMDEASISFSAYQDFLDSDKKPFNVTLRVGVWSLLYSVFFLILSIVSLIKIKTSTSTAMSIIGLSLSGLFILCDFLIMANANVLTFDLIYGVFFLYVAFIIAFAITQLIQFLRYEDIVENGKVEDLFVSKRTDLLDF